MLEWAKKNRFLGFLIDLVQRYDQDGVARSAAGVAYHLFFTLFPMLLLGNSLLSMFNLDLHEIVDRWDLVIPTCNTNGKQGYFPMKEAYDEGGYEAGSSSFKAGVAELIISEGKALLNQIR